tara:strand:+ start:3504 stop:4178 length:675 start_codon:yes stop_codon:yes gene_type:complete
MYVITGCSSGLGFEISKYLLNDKKHVLGLSRSLGNAHKFKNNDKFLHYSIDLSIEQNYSELDPFLKKRNYPEITLVLNAAKFQFEGEHLADSQITKDIFNINYFSAITLVKYFLSRNLRRVMFINSIAGLSSQSGQAQYSASKHALQSYSEVLAKYSVGKNFDVMSINPGGMHTELWENSDFLPKNIVESFLKPSDIGALVCSFLKLPKNSYIQSFTILPENDI